MWLLQNKQLDPAYGADVLRYWAAKSGLDSTVTIGAKTLAECREQVYAVRYC